MFKLSLCKILFSLWLNIVKFVFPKNLLFIVLVLGKQLTGKRLIGDPRIFSLQERIFNTFCIIAFITMCFEVPFNLFIGLMVPTLLCLFGVFISAYLYYLSRFKRKSTLGIKVFTIVCNVSFGINYFFNSGILGPNLLLFSLVFLLVVAIIPKKEFKIWLPFNALLVLAILVVEYFYPQTAPNAYMGPLSKVIDFGITYFVVIVITYFSISYLRENYDYERSLVIEKNIAIEAQNAKILIQKDELERLNTEKDKLFSLVTHDIRTPLNSIQSYLELLAETDLDEHEKLSLKQQLLEVTKDTSSMLTNVLSWSKTQMEGAKAKLVPLNVDEVLLKSLNVEKNTAVRKGVKFEITSNDDELVILADQNMFGLVIRNLVNNAIKFTSVGGVVTVDVSRVNDECFIVVTDNGLGINEVQQASLFKLAASSTFGTNNERGIGVGLLLCKEFTDLQGGKIWFKSQEGKGSMFYLSFKLVN